jgi:SNF2 family DNA or RNA helicase
MTEPFIMRRMKTDKSIISDLPDKTEMNRYCTLTKVQTALYESITKKILKEIEARQGIERRGLVLKLLLRLKQVCNHPRNFLKSGSQDIALTGKGEVLLEVIEAIKEEGSKMLIFTQFTEMGDILSNMLSTAGERVMFLHGGLSRKSRDEIVTAFQDQPLPRILILSIKAGGTGLNLTAATHVIHYDLWWNPAVEQQATDRAFRIGQKHKVTVHRLITQHTLEEKIDALIQSKKELADLTVVSGEKWIGELSNKELKELVRLG